MNRSKKLLSIMTAGLTASSVIFSGGSTVFASGSYQETEKAALDKFVSEAKNYLDYYAEEYDKAQDGSKAVLTLTAEDAGRSMLGMLTGMDFSWLNTISMDMDVSIQDSVEAMGIDLLVNDSFLCTLNALIDLGDMSEYLQIPELSESWLQIPMTVNAQDASGEEISSETLEAYYSIMSDIMSFVPDSETAGTLLDRYGTLIIDNMTEGASMEEAVSVEGISEDCTVYEGQITEANFNIMAEQILTAIKDDQEIKSLFDSWIEAGAATEEQYTQFIDVVSGLLAEIPSEDETTTDSGLISKIWVNADGKIAGREFDIMNEGESIPVFTWKNPSQGDNSATFIEISDGTESLSVTGSGQTAEGLLTGNYIVAYDGVEIADLAVENLETKPEVAGYVNGKITVSFPNNGTEDTPNPLASFGAVINLISDAEAKTSQIDLTVTSSGAPLATLSLSSSYGDGVETEDTASLGTVLNMYDEEDITAYIEGMDWTAVLDNARAAGVPEELVSQIDAALQSATAEPSSTDDTLSESDSLSAA